MRASERFSISGPRSRTGWPEQGNHRVLLSCFRSHHSCHEATNDASINCSISITFQKVLCMFLTDSFSTTRNSYTAHCFYRILLTDSTMRHCCTVVLSIRSLYNIYINARNFQFVSLKISHS
jgi:hypothetical protein